MPAFGLRMHVCGFFLCFVCAGAAAADLSSGLVGHWRFDGGSGKTVKDLSPRHNDGMIESGEWRQEKGGGSLEFNGLGGHVLICETTPFGFSNAITAAMWVKAYKLQNNTVLFGVPHPTESWTTPMFGMYAADGRVVYGMWGEKGVKKILVQSASDFPLNTWTFLAATYDGAMVRLYVNGVLSAEEPHTGPITHNGQPLS